VNIDKKYFFAFVLIGLIIIGIVGVIAYNSAGVPATFGHSVNEIDWAQTINKNITVNGYVNASYFIGEGTGTGSQWTTSGNNIYYNVTNGKVGIGIGIPSERLHIVGNLRVDGVIKGDASGNVVIQLGT